MNTAMNPKYLLLLLLTVLGNVIYAQDEEGLPPDIEKDVLFAGCAVERKFL